MDREELLTQLKSFLNFTWTDEARSTRIEAYMDSSIQYLNEIAGCTIDFENDYLARDLLFNRVLYQDSQALSDFASNYNDLMNELKIKYQVGNSDETETV